MSTSLTPSLNDTLTDVSILSHAPLTRSNHGVTTIRDSLIPQPGQREPTQKQQSADKWKVRQSMACNNCPHRDFEFWETSPVVQRARTEVERSLTPCGILCLLPSIYSPNSDSVRVKSADDDEKETFNLKVAVSLFCKQFRGNFDVSRDPAAQEVSHV